MECLICKEIYTTDDVQELKEMHEEFYQDKKCFICPDCWDDFLRKDPNDRVKILMKAGGNDV